MPIQRVTSKWSKTTALLVDPSIQPFVPLTLPFQFSNVQQALEQFGMIYVKPDNGTFGQGVIRIEHVPDREMPYRFQSGERQYQYRSFEAMYDKLITTKLRRRYLVQQGIELLTYNGRRFDLRLMVQKNLRGRWEATGLIGRIAHPHKIVTNYHSGGTPMPAETLLTKYMEPDQLASYRAYLAKLGVAVAKTMERTFKHIKEIGLDIAVDHSGKPWILEVNTMPDPFIFRNLPDHELFLRIYRYAVQYGRFKKKKLN